jgi:hypothetical protein
MRTEQELQQSLTSRAAANLSPATIHWYLGQLAPFVGSCLNLPARPEPTKAFLDNVNGSAETGWRRYRVLASFFHFISHQHKISNPTEDIDQPCRPRKEGLS